MSFHNNRGRFQVGLYVMLVALLSQFRWKLSALPRNEILYGGEWGIDHNHIMDWHDITYPEVEKIDLQSSRTTRTNKPKTMVEFPVVRPLWKCSKQSTNTTEIRPKIVFVHVFKTAGSTLRELFARYAAACHAGIGIVVACSGVSETSIRNPNSTAKWVNQDGSKKGKPCYIAATNQNQDIISKRRRNYVDRTILQYVDILAGHLPLGVGDHWFTHNDSTVNRNNARIISTVNAKDVSVVYVTFVRDAIEKFISGVMYQKKDKHLSFDEIVAIIRKRVRGERIQGKYREGYAAYLLTPKQKLELYNYANRPSNNTYGIELRTKKILSNLQEQTILVGVVERMSESLELLQFVLDEDDEQVPLFESFGMERHNNHNDNPNNSTQIGLGADIANKNGGKKVNPSKYSTSMIAAELKKDPDFFEWLREYLKYDEQIYAAAMDLHLRQYQSMMHHRANKS